MPTPLDVRAVLFDAAGTLLFVREPVGVTYARFARAAGIDADAGLLGAAFPVALRRMPPMVFPDAAAARRAELEREWWRDVMRATFVAACPEMALIHFDQLCERLFHHFSQAQAWTVVPSAHAVLATLRAGGLGTGIVSNFDHRLHGLLRDLGLRPLLDTVVLPGDAGAAKPDARIFAAALARLGVAPHQALYVGDDEDDDIAGATAAGLHAVDVRTLPELSALVPFFLLPVPFFLLPRGWGNMGEPNAG